MIRRFIKIAGTGKFLNYSHSSIPGIYRTTDFEKVNLIYGENGIGKTTLSVVLRSLKGNDALLQRKRSFDQSVSQTVEVLTDLPSNPKATFSNNAWDIHYPNIEIFDVHFINDNIYTGSEIQTIHKKNLFEIIFGQQGVSLKVDIQQLKERIKNGSKVLRNTAEKIELAISGAFLAQDFCSVAVDNLIDTKIKNKEAEISTAKSYQQIQQTELLKTIPLLSFPFHMESGISAIEKSIDSISEQFLLMFKEHRDHLKMEDAEDWLKKGFDAIQNDSCPFCQRPFDKALEIIEAYNQYFNVEYKALLKKIQEISSKSGMYSLFSYFLTLDNAMLTNTGLIDFWKSHLDNEPSILSLDSEKIDLSEDFEKVKAVIKLKIQNPIGNQSSSALASLNSKIIACNEKIVTYNTIIATYNARIVALKTSSQANLQQLELELSRLKAIKKRSDPAISMLCSDYLTYRQALHTLNTQKDAKQQLLDAHSTTVFTNYTTKINQYLRTFAPYLEIRGLDSAYVGSSTEPIVKYALHIDGNEIRQEDSATHPSFKYSLSEGDKNALAISFFLAKLEVDGNLQDKIIVFDDPVSSFDLNRKSTTISKLLNFSQQAKQLFVFTHNIVFAGEFWKAASQLSITSQCSKIEFIGNTSSIVEFFIDNETLSGVLKDSLAIKNYLINGCYSDQERRSIARCLRPALESYFHLKFFDVVLANEWLGNFIDKVRNSTASDPYNRLIGQVQELTDINDYSKKYHHRFNTNSDSEQINDTELRSFCQRTLDIIQII